MTADDLASLDESVTGAPYVYFLLSAGGAILYIGSTRQLKRRIRQHSRERDWWSEVAFIRAFPQESLDAALDVEARYINAANPPYNTHHRGGGGAFGLIFGMLSGRMPSEQALSDVAFIRSVSDSVRGAE